MAVKNVIGGTFEDIGEAVVKPVVDEVGKAIEVGVKSVVGGPNPKATQNTKPQDNVTDQTKIIEARRKIKYWKDLEEAQRRVREEQKMKQLQQAQVTQQESQEKELVEVYKKKDDTALKQAQRKTEIRGGVGG